MSVGVDARPPNIVLILADDMGFGDIGCYNPESQIPTPNIDALAQRGTRWTDMHTPSAVCTPSRYGLLTGRYAWRTHLPYGVLYGYEPALIEAGRTTLPQLLRRRGYHTACVGKWHLGMGFHTKPGETVDFSAPLPWKGEDPELEHRIDLCAPIDDGPITRGFDTFFGTAGCATAQPPFAFIDQDVFVETPTEFRSKVHFTGRPGMHARSWDHADVDPTFARRAVSRIRGFADSAQPFFLYLAASSPHEPCLEATVPPFARGQSGAGHRGDLVWLFDWMVGEVVDALRRTGQAENTLVIVTSDNGALPGDRISEVDGIEGYELYNHLSCGHWRGYKAHIWEGGHRVPFVVAPAAEDAAAEDAAAADAAGVVERAACLTDLFETLQAVTETGVVAAARSTPEDSEDLSDEVGFARWKARGPSASRCPHADRVIVHHSGFGVFSLRAGSWKYVSESAGSGGWPPPGGTFPVPGSPGQLYDLAVDPQETQNLFNSRPDHARHYQEMIDQFRAGGTTVRSES